MQKDEKKRGRPVTVDGPVTSIRLTPKLTAMIKDWSERQEDKPPHSVAIRRLLEQALSQRRSS